MCLCVGGCVGNVGIFKVDIQAVQIERLYLALVGRCSRHLSAHKLAVYVTHLVREVVVSERNIYRLCNRIDKPQTANALAISVQEPAANIPKRRLFVCCQVKRNTLIAARRFVVVCSMCVIEHVEKQAAIGNRRAGRKDPRELRR